MIANREPKGARPGRLHRLPLILLSLAALAHPVAAGLEHAVVFTQVPARAPAGPELFAGARLVRWSTDGQLTVLTGEFAAACDPDVSFDGQRLLFAGRKEADSPWAVWELPIDGTQARQVTDRRHPARQPIYLSSLFTLDSPEPWFTIIYAGEDAHLDERGHAPTTSLYSLKLDGSELRRVTFNPGPDRHPFQMWDGRLVYAAERYPKEPGPAPRVGLYSVAMEGTDQAFYGAGQGRRVQHMPCATSDGWVVFVESDAPGPDGAGQLARVHERRPHHSYRRLTTDPDHLYLHPSPWRSSQVLVSRRDTRAAAPAALVLFDLETGQAAPVFASPDHHVLQAKALRPRPMPDGRSTVVNTKSNTGVLYCQNAYDADERLQPHLTPGLFHRVRIIEGMPAGADPARAQSELDPAAELLGSGNRGPFVARRVLGEAPVEADGSFNIEVPADTPLLLQTLDERGLSLATCGWTWVKQKEARGCIGCHEDPERIPENEYVLALRRPSNRVAPPPNHRRSVTFREHILPILRTRCASADCHASVDSPLPLPILSNRATAQDLWQTYTLLTAPREGPGRAPSAFPQRGKYVDPGRARTSFLVWQLFGTNTARPWDHSTIEQSVLSRTAKPMPPHGKGGPLNRDDIRIFVEWIDLGAAFESLTPSPAQPHSQTP